MKIVITENEDFSQHAITNLSKIGNVYSYNTQSKEELLENIKDADVIFVRLRFKIDKTIINLNPNLKYILTATTGLDHIDVDYFQAANQGKVISLKNEVDFLNKIPSTAEHTWGLLLALMRNSFNAFNDVKAGFWRRDLFKGNNLAGKKIGILGLGRVGIQVAKYAQAFSMEVGYFDTEKKVDNQLKKFESANDMFAWADIITIHIPLNQQTIHFVDQSLLDILKPSAILVNTSRGAVINEKYLCTLLRKHKIKGYATDVLENELNVDFNNSELINLANMGFNVVITPHIAGATFESMHMTENFILEKFLKIYINQQ